MRVLLIGAGGFIGARVAARLRTAGHEVISPSRAAAHFVRADVADWAVQLCGNLQAMAVSGRNVVFADWLFTTPAVVVQLVTGLWLAHRAGFGLDDSWLVASVALYFLVGACWLPVVWLQIRMRRLAGAAAVGGAPLTALYHRYSRIWFALGWPAFLGVVAIFWLMIAKPVLW